MFINCPVSIGGSRPRTSQIVNVYGQPGLLGDPGANDVEVRDEGGNVVPPLPGPVNPAGLVPFFDFTSEEVHGPPHIVGYVVTIRLRDPGVRTQILKCQIWVRHRQVRCALATFGTPVLSGSLVLEAEPLFGPPMPAIHLVEVRYAEQTPPWQSATPGPLPPGWGSQVLADRIQFFLQNPAVGQPITVGGGPFQFQFALQTVGGTPPSHGLVRCLDDQPAPGLVALEHIFQFQHFP
jgi:hypothetical protein